MCLCGCAYVQNPYLREQIVFELYQLLAHDDRFVEIAKVFVPGFFGSSTSVAAQCCSGVSLIWLQQRSFCGKIQQSCIMFGAV